MPGTGQLTDQQKMLRRTQEFIAEDSLEEAYQRQAVRYNNDQQDQARDIV
jgi:hypothetical protein